MNVDADRQKFLAGPGVGSICPVAQANYVVSSGCSTICISTWSLFLVFSFIFFLSFFLFFHSLSVCLQCVLLFLEDIMSLFQHVTTGRFQLTSVMLGKERNRHQKGK